MISVVCIYSTEIEPSADEIHAELVEDDDEVKLEKNTLKFKLSF